MRWILLMIFVAPSANTRSFNQAQQSFLDARQAWVVAVEDGYVVKVEAKDPVYGHRLGFSTVIRTEDGQEKKVTEDIFAVPYNNEVYWLRVDEFIAFEKLGRVGDMRAMALLFLTLFFVYQMLRGISRMSQRGRRKPHG